MSNTHKYTPRPWEVVKAKKKTKAWISGDGWSKLAGVYVSFIGDGGRKIDSLEGRANAALIAAAPELLEALEIIVDANNNPNVGAQQLSGVINSARPIIEKATTPID